jgi:hypothetical protein
MKKIGNGMVAAAKEYTVLLSPPGESRVRSYLTNYAGKVA